MATTLSLLCALITIASLVDGLSPAQWRAQSIYQVMTDRFARTDGSMSAACDLNEYCGGTWRGLINRLDYIQNMVIASLSMQKTLLMLVGLHGGLDIACGAEPNQHDWRRQLISRLLGKRCLQA